MSDKIRTLQGRVISDKMDKSITVLIERPCSVRILSLITYLPFQL